MIWIWLKESGPLEDQALQIKYGFLTDYLKGQGSMQNQFFESTWYKLSMYVNIKSLNFLEQLIFSELKKQ